MNNENWTDNTEANEDAVFLTQEEYDLDRIEVIPTHIGGVWNITHMCVDFTQSKTDVSEYYYNPELDVFGNKDDWVCKDGWERIVVNASLPAQEVDKIFFKLFPKKA